MTRWLLAGSIALWCAVGVGVIFTDTTVGGLRVQVLVNVAAMGAAAGILAVFMHSAAARGAAGALARRLDASPLPAGGLVEAVRSALDDPSARLLFGHGTRWLDTSGEVVTQAPGRSVTVFGGPVRVALEHDPALDDDPAVVEAVGAVASLALEGERLRVLVRTGAGSGDGASRLAEVLTPREREVLGLVAQGMTDGAIAQRLFVTRRTVETHLGHIFTKLDVPAGSSENRRVHAVRRYLDVS